MPVFFLVLWFFAAVAWSWCLGSLAQVLCHQLSTKYYWLIHLFTMQGVGGPSQLF